MCHFFYCMTYDLFGKLRMTKTQGFSGFGCSQTSDRQFHVLEHENRQFHYLKVENRQFYVLKLEICFFFIKKTMKLEIAICLVPGFACWCANLFGVLSTWVSTVGP